MSKGTVVVTGANGGIGRCIVSQIMSKPELSSYHGIYTIRDDVLLASQHHQPSTNVITPHTHDTMKLDLSDLNSVRETAAAINARVSAGEIPPIRALVLNAGYVDLDKQRWNPDGLSMAFVANYLGHWLLTLLLLQSMDKDMGRIVVVGSKMHNPYEEQNAIAFTEEKWNTIIVTDSTDPIAKGTWSAFEDDPTWRSGLRRYGAAKLCLTMMIGELQRRLDTDPELSNISILGVDPGSVPTGIARLGPWYFRVLIYKLVLPALATLLSWFSPSGHHDVRTTDKSAADVLAAALDCNPVLGERPKGLYLDGSQLAETSAESKDLVKRKLVWEDSVRYAQLEKGETALVNYR